MPALIDYDLINTFGAGAGDWETDPLVTRDPSGFDAVKATLCFRGTALQLMEGFALGAQSCPGLTGKPLYFAGPTVQESRFGFQIAEMEWIGAVNGWPATPTGASVPAISLASDGHVIGIDYGMTTDEARFPQERGGQQILAKHPDKQETAADAYLHDAGVLLIGGTAVSTGKIPWRVRFVGRVYTLSLKGIILGDAGAPFRAPKLTSTANPFLTGDSHRSVDWKLLPDPLITTGDGITSAGGWVCRNYSVVRDVCMGTKALRAWKADYEWVDRYGP